MRRIWVGTMGLALALAITSMAHDARAEPPKKSSANASVKLDANGELLVRLIGARSVPSALGAQATSDLALLAKQLRSGDKDGALSGWKKFLAANAKQLTQSDATQASLWMIRAGLLEPDDQLASAADKVRYAREVTAKLNAGIAALEAAKLKAKASGKPVTVGVVSVVPYSKFKPGIKETTSALTEAEARSMIDSLKQQQESISEMNQMDMLALQAMMEKKGQLEQMISNVMKSASEAQNTVASSLKAS